MLFVPPAKSFPAVAPLPTGPKDAVVSSQGARRAGKSPSAPWGAAAPRR